MSVGGKEPTNKTSQNQRSRPSGDSTTTTMPFDVPRLDDMDRYHLAMAVILVSRASNSATAVRQLIQHGGAMASAWTRQHREALPEVARWIWPH